MPDSHDAITTNGDESPEPNANAGNAPDIADRPKSTSAVAPEARPSTSYVASPDQSPAAVVEAERSRRRVKRVGEHHITTETIEHLATGHVEHLE